jgi:hypothetical protein
MLRSVPFAVIVAVLIAVTTGCGGSTDGRLEISGEVTFDGKPIPDGYVTLSPLGSGPSAGGRIRNGKFTVERKKGPKEGKYRVSIEAMRETGKKIAIDPAIPDDKVPETVQYIPARYNSRSELTADVSAENTHFTWKLSSQKPNKR